MANDLKDQGGVCITAVPRTNIAFIDAFGTEKLELTNKRCLKNIILVVANEVLHSCKNKGFFK